MGVLTLIGLPLGVAIAAVIASAKPRRSASAAALTTIRGTATISSRLSERRYPSSVRPPRGPVACSLESPSLPRSRPIEARAPRRRNAAGRPSPQHEPKIDFTLIEAACKAAFVFAERPLGPPFSAKRGRCRRRRRMGCGKQGAWAASSRKRSCKPSGVVAAGHTPSGASRPPSPASWGRDSARRSKMCEHCSPTGADRPAQ